MSRANAVYICGGDMRPGPRDECPNVLHDWPLPAGYVDAAEVAASRLYRKWSNTRCANCGLYGWRPGRIDPETDHKVVAVGAVSEEESHNPVKSMHNTAEEEQR